MAIKFQDSLEVKGGSASKIYLEGAGGTGSSTILQAYNPDDGAGHGGGTAYLKSSGWGEAQLAVGSYRWTQAGGKMTVTGGVYYFNTGNVGIGTGSPSSKLTVAGRVDFQNDLRLRGTDSAANQGVVRFYVDDSNKLYIDTANDGNNRFSIDSNGDVNVDGDLYSYAVRSTNYWIGNALYFGGANNYLNWNAGNSSIYSNVNIQTAATLYANGGNSGQWNQAVGWGDHADAGYKLFSNELLPSRPEQAAPPDSYPLGLYLTDSESSAPYSWVRDAGIVWGIHPANANNRHLQFIANHDGSELLMRMKNGTADEWRDWNHLATRSWVSSQNYGDATQAWVQAQGYLTSETDSQTLSFNDQSGELTISNGNTVDLDNRYFDATGRNKWYNINAAGTQAKRYRIARVYYCPQHWANTWQNIEFELLEEGYNASYVKYSLIGFYNGSTSQTLNLKVTDFRGLGTDTQRYNMFLGDHIDAGWEHSGRPVFFTDIFVDVSYYKGLKITADTFGHTYQNTDPTSGAAITVFYDNPDVVDIDYTNVAKTNTYVGDDAMIWNTGNFTQANVNNWNTAYGWGNHASAGYLTSIGSHTHSAADITSGTLNGARLPWASGNDGFTGTYGIVWRAGDNPWTASWLTVNGQLDQLNSRAFGSYVGDTGIILKSYNASASNAEQFYIRHNNGSVDIANPRGNIYYETPTYFETTTVVQDTLYVGVSVQRWGDGGTGMYFNTDSVDIRTNSVTRIEFNNSGVSIPSDVYFTGNSRKIYLTGGDTNSQNGWIVGEQDRYGFGATWDSGLSILFQGWDGRNVTDTHNKDLGSVNIRDRVWNFLGSARLNNNDLATEAWVEEQPPAPAAASCAVVGDTIEVSFDPAPESPDYYQVWASQDGGSYSLIAQIPTQDFSPFMTVVDTAFSVSGLRAYRVYAVRRGIYSDPATTSRTYTQAALEPVNMNVVPMEESFFVQWDAPASRFVDHYEVYLDTHADQGSLNRNNANLVYSGNNTFYMHPASTNEFHQFWVEIAES